MAHPFYDRFFAKTESSLGPINRETIVAIIGFDAGGPLNFCTIGEADHYSCMTYVSCELAVRKEQLPSQCGRYELLVSCDDERWVRSIISDIGRMTLETVFGNGHTMDIGPWVEPDAPLQGVVFEEACRCRIDGESFGVLRVIGVSRAEMEYAQEHGIPALVRKLKSSGIYPRTLINRRSAL